MAANKVVALYEYVAERADELSFKEGEIIEMVPMAEPPEGWAMGLLSTGQTGLYPLNFVEKVEENQFKVPDLIQTILDNRSQPQNGNSRVPPSPNKRDLFMNVSQPDGTTFTEETPDEIMEKSDRLRKELSDDRAMPIIELRRDKPANEEQLAEWVQTVVEDLNEFCRQSNSRLNYEITRLSKIYQLLQNQLTIVLNIGENLAKYTNLQEETNGQLCDDLTKVRDMLN